MTTVSLGLHDLPAIGGCGITRLGLDVGVHRHPVEREVEAPEVGVVVISICLHLRFVSL